MRDDAAELRFQLDRAEERETELREYIQIVLDDNQRLAEAVIKLSADVERACACVVAVTALVNTVSQLARKVL